MIRRSRHLRRALLKLRGWTDVAALEQNGLRLGKGAYLGHDVFLDPEFCFLIEIEEGQYLPAA